MRRLSINELWRSQNNETWRITLEVYWRFLSPALLPIEEDIDKVDVQTIQGMNPQEWYEFLLENYFR